MARVNLTRHELDVLIHTLDHDAVLADNDGRFPEADSLALRVVTLRNAGR
jgi:hypothetical protein